MKILLLINTFGSGGAERSTYEIATWLMETGDIQVVAAALNHKEIGIERAFAELPIPSYIGDGQTRWQRLRFVIDTIRREQPDIVHSILFEANLLSRLARPFTHHYLLIQSLVNTPYVAGRRLQRGWLNGLKFRLAKLADICTARLADIHYHSVSASVADHYRPLFGFSKRRYTIVRRGRPALDCPAGDRTATSMPPPVFRMVNVGRQEYQKGQVGAVRALAKLKHTHGLKDLRLEFYGRAGQETANMQEAIASEGLEQEVHLMGFTDSVHSVLCASDLFVFPSYFEGAAGALVEAMRAGLPAVCSDIPVLREVVGDPPCVLFFPPGDEGALADRIARLYHDPTLRRRLAAAGKERFATTFRKEAVAEQMIQLYRDVYAQHPAAIHRAPHA